MLVLFFNSIMYGWYCFVIMIYVILIFIKWLCYCGGGFGNMWIFDNVWENGGYYLYLFYLILFLIDLSINYMYM